MGEFAAGDEELREEVPDLLAALDADDTMLERVPWAAFTNGNDRGGIGVEGQDTHFASAVGAAQGETS